MLKRLLFYVIGLTIASLGAALFIIANIGADSVTTFTQVLADRVGISIGICTIIFFSFFLVLVLIIDRKKITIFSFIYSFLFGFLFDFFLLLIRITPTYFIEKIFIVILATLFLGLGLGMYQSANLGSGPSDAFLMILVEKMNSKLRVIRTLFDFSLVGISILLGGKIGIGTITGMFFVGFVLSNSYSRCLQILKNNDSNSNNMQ